MKKIILITLFILIVTSLFSHDMNIFADHITPHPPFMTDPFAWRVQAPGAASMTINLAVTINGAPANTNHPNQDLLIAFVRDPDEVRSKQNMVIFQKTVQYTLIMII